MNLQIIFLIILGIVSVIYLISLRKICILQFVLKGWLIPLVLAVYLTGCNTLYLPVVLALVFAWIGDVVLLKIYKISWFRMGLASFLVGHIFYCIAMLKFIYPVNLPVLLISIAVALGFCITAYKVVKPSKQMQIPVIAYEVIIMVMAIFALQFFLVQNSTAGILVFAGSLCFVASDTMLALKTFRRVKIYFLVMLTYISAQLLIALGFAGL